MTQRPARSRRSSIGAGDRPAAGRGGWRGTVARVAGIVVTLGAIWSLLSIAIGGFRWAEWVENAFLLVGVPTAPTLFSAALLSLLGSALRRRLRAALIVAVVLETVNLATYVVALAAGPSISRVPGRIESTRMTVIAIAAAVSALVVVLLIASRREFPARLRPGSRRLSLAVLVGGLALATGAGLAIAATFPHGLYGTDERVDWALDAALGFSVPGLRHPSLGPGWGHFLVSTFSLLVLLAAVAIALRAANAKEFLGPHDELRLRALLDRYGERDSLGYFATRRDKSVIFAPDGEAAVTYRTLGGVSLASADPVGRTGSWPAAIAAWLAEARLHGRSPAVLSASEEGAGAYVAAGLKAVPLGDEAVVEIDRFRLDDRALRQVRQAVRRVDQAGYRIEVRRHAELDPELLAEIARLAEQWRGNAVERGFSMALGRLGDRVDGRCVMVLARDRDGALRGLQSYVPWGARGLSLELMRRDPTSPNGVTEALIVALIRSAPDYGVRRVSLNFAVFRSVFESAERTGAGPLVRIGDGLLGFASRFWQLESLYRANAKYEPQWVPRYVCVDSNLSITRTAIAAASAEGFLPGQRHQLPENGSEVAVAYEGASMALADAICRQREQFVRSLPAPAAPGRQTRDRLVKLERLRAAGIDPYPPHVDRDRTIAAVLARHAGLAAGAAGGERVAVCGRVRVLRDFGGLVFAVLEEGGATIQVMVDASVAGDVAHSLWRRTVDPGDLVAVQGDVVASRSGELSVLASGWTMAAKCLRPVPAVHAGFRDPEARVRDRALDMIVNPDSVGVLEARSRAVAAVRDQLRDRGFLEVETPILQTVHGGAAARPFRTHINAYDLDLSLRIAPELYLKRLAVGGMEAIFELGRNFRNEGADATHNPEFTSLEAYQAHGDYSSMRELARELIVAAAVAVHGEPVALRPAAGGSQRPVAIGGSWPVVAVHAAVAEAVGAAVTPATGADELRRLCAAHGVAAGGEASAGMLVLALYEGLVEKRTVEPVFYTDFPIEAAPLTRPHRDDPRLAERWDLVAFGMELGTAYSELIDPVDQRRRLTAQSALAAAGDPEAMELDEAFLGALEYGMPPTGGLGIGIDRIVMMLLGATIRGSLAFPFVRPRSERT